MSAAARCSFSAFRDAGAIADAEALLRLRRKPALAQISARLAAIRALQRILEEPRRLLHHVVQRGARRLALLRVRVAVGKRQPRLLRELRHGFRKAQPLLLDQEGEMVAGDAAAEAVVAALAVLGVEGWRLLAMERAAGPIIAAAGIGFPLVPRDLAPDHVRDRDAGADVVEEGGGESHLDEASTMRFAPAHGRWRQFRHERPKITGSAPCRGCRALF